LIYSSDSYLLTKSQKYESLFFVENHRKLNDTISAISTPKGEGGISIIRLSGPSSLSIIDKIFQPRSSRTKIASIETHTITYGHIVNPKTHEVIDEVLVSVMLAPRTYTREDIVEINCHGGSIPLLETLELTLQMGARLAEPGEFTKRAFLNGRIDLIQAEAVADIVRAKTDLSLKVAVNQLEGRLSKKIRQIRDIIMEVLVNIEASIDFPDEDIDIISLDTMSHKIDSAIEISKDLLSTADDGRIITEGLKGVILGKPNVGKSSIFNALLNEDRALVTSIPGTTRDAIEEFINIDGVPVKLTDTAGIRQSDDVIEIESIARAKMYLDQADIILMVLDASSEITDEDRAIISLVANKKTIIVINKIDLNRVLEIDNIQSLAPGKPVVSVSARDERGFDLLRSAIKNMVLSTDFLTADAVFVTRSRHKKAIKDAAESLEYAYMSIKNHNSPDLIAVDLRGALRNIGEIVGEIASDEILDQIFSKFCIGK